MTDIKKQIKADIIWIGIALLVVAACTANAFLEETTLMRILSLIGALVGLIAAGFNLADLMGALRKRRENAQDERK